MPKQSERIKLLPFAALGILALASPSAIILHEHDVPEIIASVFSDGPPPAGTGADLRQDPASPSP
ncbi:hypothetical protein ACFWPV_05960 [Streptomyces uncialis]|uniref:hypothetical protein n=1 Tax=Streptomyces uncialis TaxID=1048205 RepID=UPI0036562DF4